MREVPVQPGSPRVLIVDDEPAICSALVQVLRRAGFDPVAATGASEAEPLLSESIAAMVVDFRMPGTRGDAFFFQVVARFPHLRGRVIFTTGDISPDAERLIAQTGCQCLWKPFANAALVDAVRELFSEQQHPVGAR